MEKRRCTFADAILFGKYQLLQVIGTGRTCEVYLARHIGLEEYRAIKKIPRTSVDHTDFHKEATILKGLKAPGIPVIYDLEEDEDYFYLIEEYLEGLSLQELAEKEGTLSKAMTVSIGIQICRLVYYLHSAEPNPILYLDLQPNNLLLCHDTVKLIDFGQAIFLRDAGNLKKRYGTVGYAAPEQVGVCQSDARADIYSLGVVLNQVVTGAFPNAARADGLLGEVIARCTNLDPQQRYSNVRELDAALAALPCRRAAPPRPAARTGYPYPLCLVPGFRSGSGQKALAAVAAAFWFFVFAAAGYSTAAGDPVECLIVTGVLAIPVGSYVLVFDLFGIQRHIPILNKAQGRGMRIAATAAAVLLWAAAAFLITVLASAALKAVLQ